MIKSMSVNSVSSMLLALLALMLFAPEVASAASVSFSQTAQSALAKHIAEAPVAYKEKLNEESVSLQAYQRQENGLDTQYSTLHGNNRQALEAVRQRMKQIDADKIARLTNEVSTARERYKPMLDHQTAINKQIANAKSMKLKELAAALKMQADALQPALLLARADLRKREDALKTAKEAKAKIVKGLKTTLSGIDQLHDQTRLAQSSVSGSKGNIPGIVKTMNACVKSGSHSGTLQSLTTLVSLSKSIVEQKTRIVDYENRTTAIIKQVNAQIPAK